MVTDHLFQPEFGAGFVGMANLDGYVSIAADASIVAGGCALPPGVTVVHTTTGVYTVTLSRPYPKVFPHVIFQAYTAVALFAQLGDVTTSSFVVHLVNGSGVLTDPSAACGFDFQVRIKTSGV